MDKVETDLLERYGDLEAVWATGEPDDAFLELPLRMMEVIQSHKLLKIISGVLACSI